MFVIKKVGVENIDTIHELAHAIWPVSYKGIITEEQIDYMLELIYSTEALRDQIQNLKHQFSIIYNAETPVGFASYSPKADDVSGVYRLNKLYLLPNQQGKGTGKIMLNYIVDEIKKAGATAVELNVNKHNPAFHFYIKNNFTITKDDVLDIGNGYVMDDYIMTKDLG